MTELSCSVEFSPYSVHSIRAALSCGVRVELSYTADWLAKAALPKSWPSNTILAPMGDQLEELREAIETKVDPLAAELITAKFEEVRIELHAAINEEVKRYREELYSPETSGKSLAAHLETWRRLVSEASGPLLTQ